jgi:hypothetical protein
MYWDSLTAAGVIVSIVSTLGAFFLEWRKRPIVRDNNLRKT